MYRRYIVRMIAANGTADDVKTHAKSESQACANAQRAKGKSWYPAYVLEA